MGTRSLTKVIESNTSISKKEEICTIYRQYDGYPVGHGLEIAEFLSKRRIVNGISTGEKRIANRAGDLAAQLIHFLKTNNEIGNIYIEPAGTNDVGEEYIYEIFCEVGSQPWIVVKDYDFLRGDTDQPVFAGTASDMVTWIQDKYVTKEGVTA